MILNRCREYKINQTMLAERTGIARPTLSNYLSGVNDIPVEVFFKICAALFIDTQSMVTLYEDYFKEEFRS